MNGEQQLHPFYVCDLCHQMSRSQDIAQGSGNIGMHDPVLSMLCCLYTAAWFTVHLLPVWVCVDNETSDTPPHAAAVIRMGGYYVLSHVVGKGKL